MTELISRTHRFSQDTLDQIKWLGARLGGLDATNVLRVAVAERYHRKQALEKLPKDEQTQMLIAETDGLALLMKLLLRAAAADEKVWLDEATFDELVGLETEIRKPLKSN
jgi:hypothetical protein